MRGTVMTIKRKRRLEKMNFLPQERKIEQMTQNENYLWNLMDQKKSIEEQKKNIQSFERGGQRPKHTKTFFLSRRPSQG